LEEFLMARKPTYEKLEKRVRELEKEALERNHAEKALRESEERYKAVFQSAAEGILVADIETRRFRYANPAIRRMLDYTEEELRQMNVADIHPKAALDHVISEFEAQARGEKALSPNIPCLRKDGRTIYADINTTSVLIDGRKCNVGFFTDISERRQAEEALRGSEEKYRTILENIEDGYFEVDIAGNLTFFNKALCKILGYCNSELTGMNNRQYLDRENAQKVYQSFNKVYTTGHPDKGFDWEIIRKDGIKRDVEASISLMRDMAGRPIGFRGIVRDITDRKLMEQELHKQAHQLGERVKELNCLYSISKLRDQAGISFREILQGIVDLIPSAWQYPEITCARVILNDLVFKTKNFNETLWKLTSNIIADREKVGALEVFYLEERPESHEGPFQEEERSLINAIAERLGRIVDRRRAEEALQKAHDELERRVEERTAELVIANKKLNQEIEVRRQAEEELKKSSERIKLFAYSVSHDLKSPAVGIYGLAKLLLKNYRNVLDEKGKDFCDRILKASEQIAALVENINVFISTKEAPLTIERINLKEILQMTKEEISTQLNIRQIRWSEPEYLPEIKADRLSILRILRNLVDNALKYGGEDLSKIKVGYEESDESHILSVEDDGVGIEMEDSEKIFGAFERKKTSRGIQGTGLGLAIVKEIAEQHSGKVWVKPGPEKGTAFYISISKDIQLS
jgi:PAS domain S-box-containing protein